MSRALAGDAAVRWADARRGCAESRRRPQLICFLYRSIERCLSTLQREGPIHHAFWGARMAETVSIDPEPQDFRAAEATHGQLREENGSPAAARIRYEVAQAHKLIRLLRAVAQRR